MTVGIFGTVFVVLAILVIVLVSVTGNKTNSGVGFGMKPAPAAVVNALTHVQASAFTDAGSTIGQSGPYTSSLIALKSQPPLTSGGKPEVVYVGANYCPYCAATRWPFVVALARFGTFKNLQITESGRNTSEPYPGTPTLSFYHSSYSSPYITFKATEQCTDISSSSTSTAVQQCSGYKPLEPMPKDLSKILLKYDATPYVPSTDAGSIPFFDFANKFLGVGAFMDPSILGGGLTQVQIAQSLGNPVASPAQTILVSANYYTAAICKLTNNKPGSVCDMPVVKQAAKALKL